MVVLIAFCTLLLGPAITSYRTPLQRLGAVVLSFYVLGAFAGLGVLFGALIIYEWPHFFWWPQVDPEVNGVAEDAARGDARVPDLAAFAAITDAVEGGAGLRDPARAARALDASLILIDRSAAVLAVAARSPADERSLMRDADDVTTVELKVADAPVGQLRMRSRAESGDSALLRLVTTLIASEVERVRAPERASEEAAATFQRAVLARRIEDRDDLIARGRLGTDLGAGASVTVVRAHARNPTEDDWRRRLLAVAARGARSIANGAIATPTDGDGEVVLLVLTAAARPAAGSRPRSCASSRRASPGSPSG